MDAQGSPHENRSFSCRCRSHAPGQGDQGDARVALAGRDPLQRQADVVVQDYVAFHEQRESLLMLNLVVQSERSIVAGRTSPSKAVIARLRAQTARRHRGE